MKITSRLTTLLSTALLAFCAALGPVAQADDLDIYNNFIPPTPQAPLTVIGLDLNLLNPDAVGCRNVLLPQPAPPALPDPKDVNCSALQQSVTLGTLLGVVGMLPGGVGGTIAPTVATVTLLVPGVLDMTLAAVMNLPGLAGSLVPTLNTLLLTGAAGGNLPATLTTALPLFLALSDLLQQLINSRVAIMLNHGNQGPGTPPGSCAFADGSSLGGERQDTPACSNGGYFFLGLIDLTRADLVLNKLFPLLLSGLTQTLAVDPTTGTVTSTIGATVTVDPTTGAVTVTPAASTSLTSKSPYQTKEMYAEFMRYLRGDRTFNAKLATNDNALGKALVRDKTIEKAGNRQYQSALDTYDKACTINFLHIQLTNADVQDDSDDDLLNLLPGVPKTPRPLKLAEVVTSADKDGFIFDSSRRYIRSYFLVQDSIGNVGDLGALANLGGNVNTYTNVLGLIGRGRDLASATSGVVKTDASLVSASFTSAPTEPNGLGKGIYIAQFQPDQSQRPVWPGNVKKLQVPDKDTGLPVNQFVAVNGPGISTTDGRIEVSALTYWTDSSNLGTGRTLDGRETQLGGAGQKIPGYKLNGGGDPGRANPVASLDTARKVFYDSYVGSKAELKALNPDEGAVRSELLPATGAVGYTSTGSSCSAACNTANSSCSASCGLNQTTCNALCGSTVSSCNALCGTNQASCNVSCGAAQTPCLATANTAKTGCDATALSRQTACNGTALTEEAACIAPHTTTRNACETAATGIRASCNTTADGALLTCNASCPPLAGPARTKCLADCATANTTARGNCTTTYNNSITTCTNNYNTGIAPCVTTYNNSTTTCNNTYTTDTAACTSTQTTAVNSCNSTATSCVTGCNSMATSCGTGCGTDNTSCGMGCAADSGSCNNACTNSLNTCQSACGVDNTRSADTVNKELLLYARGFDVGTFINPKGDGPAASKTDNGIKSRPWMLGAVLHSKPVAINYGKRGGRSEDDVRVAYGSADGLMHLVNDENGPNGGKEVWSFMPQAVMNSLAAQRENNAGSPVMYGVDGAPVVLIKDRAGTADGPSKGKRGVIGDSPEDQVTLIFGLRRGGAGYYAIDVTNPDVPKLQWSIGPSGLHSASATGAGIVSGSETAFSQLGLSFSTPQLGRMSVQPVGGGAAASRPVLIFGGGYNGGLTSTGSKIGKDLNNSRNPVPLNRVGKEDILPADRGNALFIVDAETGNLVWRAVRGAASGSPFDSTSLAYSHPLLTDGIASEVTALDTNSDGLLDRLYVGDTGGRLWRADFPGSNRNAWTATPVANLGRHGTASTTESDRRFFHAPDYVPIRNKGTAYDIVLIASGDRENPLDVKGENYLYAFRDIDVVSGKSADQIVNLDTDTIKLPDESKFVDQTDACTSAESGCTDIGLLPDDKKGWRLKLTQKGEKAFSSPLTVGGIVLLSTYIPPDSSALKNSCTQPEGSGRIYALNLADSSPSKIKVFRQTTTDRFIATLAPGLTGDISALTADALAVNAEPLNAPKGAPRVTSWRERLGEDEKKN